jgi:uncharacterized repeat protein (TIGR03803 family)
MDEAYLRPRGSEVAMRSSFPVPAIVAVVLSSCFSPANLGLPPANDTQAASARGSPRYREKVLYDFTSPGYGANYVSPLTADGHGDYFGTTEVGGTGHGTVYELMPNGKGDWSESTLHVFTGGADGGTPASTPLIFDKNADLYGITDLGGANNSGVAYELLRSGTTWSEHVLYTFGVGSSMGDYPFSFVADSKGDFFGTYDCYQDGGGITEGVFELSRSSKGWITTLIFNDNIPSATSGGGGLAIDAKGNIFGVTSLAFKPSEIFELSPSGSTWAVKILYTFPRIRIDPEAPPVLDTEGNIYGATVAGGSAGAGTVYELTSSKSSSWTYKTLYAFKGGSSDGAAPYASVTFDSGGDIYGTTAVGGGQNDGTVYELTPSGRRYASKVLWSFDGKDGSEPFGQVTLDANGHIFGTTTQGGSNHGCAYLAGCGDAFEVK